jgi:eukaryotic-like serine/threonine-protein kinase
MTNPAAVGSLAPDFDLPSTAPAGRSRSADYRGRWLVLIFYPRDFSLVCPTELIGIGQRIEEFVRRGCDVLGVSADTLESHRRWIATPRAQGGLPRLWGVSRNAARGSAGVVHHRSQRCAAIPGGS